MTKTDALRDYYRAKIDSQRDPMLLNDGRLSAAVFAMQAADFNAWCERMGIFDTNEAPIEDVEISGTNNDAAFVALATVAAERPDIVKITPINEPINAAEHFNELKKTARKQG